MSTRTRGNRLSGDPARRAEQLDERAFKRRPRCQCSHGGHRCGRRAAFRFTLLCAVRGCPSAVGVHLVCAVCLEQWLAHAAECSSEHRHRVTPL